MLEGESRHEDSAGHKGTIEAGGVQWMCAVSPLREHELEYALNCLSSRDVEVSNVYQKEMVMCLTR